MIDVVLHGCQGKMGRAVAAAASGNSGLRILYGVDRNPTDQGDFPVFFPLKECPAGGDVIVDFSSHEAVSDLLGFALQRKLPLVLASTGLIASEQDQINEASKQIPIFQAPNFSIGINMLTACMELMLPMLQSEFDVEIIDIHHKQKKDAPSGTALQLANVAKECVGEEMKIGVTSLRIGTIPGEHTVIFAGPDEVIELKHTALSRDIFARGALKAAAFLAGKPPGAYSMKDLIAGCDGPGV
jgi:4-hydroxy-tetrahydrodipicolinate reductase